LSSVLRASMKRPTAPQASATRSSICIVTHYRTSRYAARVSGPPIRRASKLKIPVGGATDSISPASPSIFSTAVPGARLHSGSSDFPRSYRSG
jgi:hypothetical protein